MGIIESANNLSIYQFRSEYFSNPLLPLTFTRRGQQQQQDEEEGEEEYTISIEDTRSMREVDMRACFDLVQETSSDTYKRSDVGWSATKKWREMRSRDMRYVLVKCGGGQGRRSGVGWRSDVVVVVVAFLSFMLTYEDGFEVVYCYELHVSAELRGCGIGKTLMDWMEHVGRKVGVEKAMLTVFRNNEDALRFYQKRGYFVDEYSPEPRQLRNGKIKESSYIILSKPLLPPAPARAYL